MDQTATARGPAVHQELDCVVENAGNVFADVIFQMIALVDNSFVLVVVVAVVGCTVDHVGNAVRRKLICIPGHEVSTKEEEPIDDLRAETLVNLVFVFFARSASVVKILICHVFRGHKEHAIGAERHSWERCLSIHAVSIAFSLPLAAWCPEVMVIVSHTLIAHLDLRCLVRRNPVALVQRTAYLRAREIDRPNPC